MQDDLHTIPGYSAINLTEYVEFPETKNWTAEEWTAEFTRSGEWLSRFLAARDPFIVLARSAVRLITESHQTGRGVRTLEQTVVEITQALILSGDCPPRTVPTSPANFERYWDQLNRNLRSFINKNENETQTDAEYIVARRARIQTMYYRNLFSRDYCIDTLEALLKKIDERSNTTLGYKLSELFLAMVRIVDIVLERFDHLRARVRTLLTSNDRAEVTKSIAYIQTISPVADRIWRAYHREFSALEDLRAAGFQLSELAYPWVFTLPRKLLESEFPAAIVNALFGLSFRQEDLKDYPREHLYLDNPVWAKPYIALDEDHLFAALPQLVFSFPFGIIEALVGINASLTKAYEAAKSEHLEQATQDLLQKAMPGASVERSVVWDDPETGKQLENDVVGFLGNFVFVFEAKSGRIKDASRRGGVLSLKKNFKDLFVEPGIQGQRLQKYLDSNGKKAVLRRKSDHTIIDIRPERPKVVFRFSVCFEHFCGLTSAKHHLRDLGLLPDTSAWAPVLSIGELEMISRYLDTEISFQHYLTRRATLEEILEFDGDEQDILSMYLVNGLWLRSDTFEDRRVSFFEADSLVRQPKTPRADRRATEIFGVQLSPVWKAICKELYQDQSQRHRFDIINVILNQLPPALTDFERRIRRFRRGVPHKGEDMLMVDFSVGKRRFVLACYLAKQMPDPEEWQQSGRNVVGMFMKEGETVDCATFIFARRSKEMTFDGVSFYRYAATPTSEKK